MSNSLNEIIKNIGANLRSMLIVHSSEESTSTDDWRSDLCLLLILSCLTFSAWHFNVLSESLMTGVNVSTLVVTLPSELVYWKTVTRIILFMFIYTLSEIFGVNKT